MVLEQPRIPIPIASVSTKLVYFIYAVAIAFNGFLCSFPGAIYVQLQQSLNTSVVIVSWIYTAFSIGYIVSNVVCGSLTDQIKESHRLQSAMLFACGIAVICVPFTSNVFFVFALFVIIGIGWASNETHFTLLIFRLYPSDGPKMFFLTIVVYAAFAVISTLLIQFSVSITGTYMPAFVLFGSIGILHSIAIVFIETPKHDKQRAIKRRASKVQQKETDTLQVMDSDKLAEVASTKLNESKSYSKLQNVTIALLMVSMCLHGAAMNGFLSFTTVYCRDYLHIDDKYGRYFITSFWAGSLLIIILRQIVAPNSSPVFAVVVSNMLRSIIQVMFIPLSTTIDSNSSIVFLVMYGLCGVTTMLVVPALCSWAELIRPTTGLIACLWWVLGGIGNATMTVCMGELIEKYGAKWIPFIICVPLFISTVVNTIAVVTYKMVRKQEKSAFEEIKQAATETDTFKEPTDTATAIPMA